MSNKFINNLIKIIIIVAIILGIISAIAIFFNIGQASSTETNRNEDEIKYLDTKLLSLINYLNNIELQNYKITLDKVEIKSNESSSTSESEGKGGEQKGSTKSGANKEETQISKMEEASIITKKNETDWDTIEGEIELLYSTWPTIVLDLYNINVNSEDILAFSSTIDDVILNVKKQDKALSAMYIAKLYSYLPKFLDKNSEDEIKRETLVAKVYIINAYAYAETKNFEKMITEVSKAENIFKSLVNDARFAKDKRKYNINKAYVLIGELRNSLDTQDTDIFYVKYKNTIEELNILS